VAKPKAPKQRDQESAKSRLYLTVETALLKRFKHTAVDLGLSESELFELLASMNCGGVHARGVSDELRAAAAGQGRAASDPAVVRIDRIGQIARSAAAPVDRALESLGQLGQD
jgi:hypothetical protein